MAGKRRFKTAFILGAGLGTRLLPLTQQCPKPLLSLGGRPIITYAMDHLIGVGIDRFIVNTHYHPEVYGQIFPDLTWRGVPIILRHETVLLDTGGGLKNIEDLLGEDDAIICYNGDIISTLPLQNLLTSHNANGAEVTLALRSGGGLLNVTIGEKGQIVDLRHTLGREGAQDCLFTGIYAVEKAFLRHMDSGRVESIISVLLRRIVKEPGSVRGVVIDDGDWSDIGSIEVYERMKDRGKSP